jgi:hypothetical protein
MTSRVITIKVTGELDTGLYLTPEIAEEKEKLI